MNDKGFIYENKQLATILLQGVFALDSPLDLFGVWEYFARELKRHFNKDGKAVAECVAKLMQD